MIEHSFGLSHVLEKSVKILFSHGEKQMLSLPKIDIAFSPILSLKLSQCLKNGSFFSQTRILQLTLAITLPCSSTLSNDSAMTHHCKISLPFSQYAVLGLFLVFPG